MAINLTKGQRISLTKDNEGLSKIMVGLGWDPIKKQSKGLLGSIFGGSGGADMDCDASVFMLNGTDKLEKKENLIYYGNLKSRCASITHTGDNLTGDGDGDDEAIIVDLSKIPSDVKKLVFVVNIYNAQARGQHFGQVTNAYIRVLNKNNSKEMVRFNLTDDYSGKTGLIVGEIYRNGSEWKFGALGEGTNDASLSEMSRRYK